MRITLQIDPRNETQKGRIYNVTTWFYLTYKLAGKECEKEEEQWFMLPFTFYNPGKIALSKLAGLLQHP